VGVLSVRNRVSRRDVVELCEQLFGARISAGTVDAILTRVADARLAWRGSRSAARAASRCACRAVLVVDDLVKRKLHAPRRRV
jgi:stalled ribosome rescue protein Dom34